MGTLHLIIPNFHISPHITTFSLLFHPRPPSLQAFPRPRFPVQYTSHFQHPSPIIFRHGRPIYTNELPALSPRVRAPRPVIPPRYTVLPQVPDTRPQFILPPPPPMPVMPSAAPRTSTPSSARQPPAATVTSGAVSMSGMSPQVPLFPSHGFTRPPPNI